MKGYLTLKETVQYIGRTENTVRRVLVRKRESINKKEGYKVIKHNERKYYIAIKYLDKRYIIDNTKDTIYKTKLKQLKSTESEELIELRETIKMYSIMLEEKNKQIDLFKSQLEEKNNITTYFMTTNKSLINALDQAQKLNALDKNTSFISSEE